MAKIFYSSSYHFPFLPFSAVVLSVGENQERMGRGKEKGEGERGKETKGNQRERGDITVDGFGYSLKVSQLNKLKLAC